MIDLVLIVEGKEDENFIKQLIEKKINSSKKIQFLKIGTNAASFSDLVKQQILTSTVNLTKPHLFILDADHQIEEYAKALKEDLVNLKEELLFFLPDNSSNGSLESLIKACVPSQYKSFFNDCIEGYAKCVEEQNIEGYAVDEKDKLFIYFSSLSKSSGKGIERLYLDRNFDFDHPELEPLKNFLETHIK